MLHKVHVLMNCVGVGHFSGLEPQQKVKVEWIPHRAQPHMGDKSTIKEGVS